MELRCDSDEIAARIINNILNNMAVILITRLIDNSVFPNTITFRGTIWLNCGISTIIRSGIRTWVGIDVISSVIICTLICCTGLVNNAHIIDVACGVHAIAGNITAGFVVNAVGCIQRNITCAK